MKKITFLLLSAVLVFTISCGSNQNAQNNTEDQASKTSENINPKMDKATVSKILQGNWVTEVYFSTIEQTKSTIIASQKVELILGFFVAEQDNELFVNEYSLHEGGGHNPLLWNSEKQAFENTENTYFAPNGFSIHIIDSLLIEVDYNGAKANEKFRKNTANLAEEVNEILFVGKYANADQEVEFTANGKIIGLAGVSEYKVPLDLFEYSVDILNFQGEENYSVHYKFDGDKLILYNIKLGEPGEWKVLDEYMTLTKK